MHAPPTTPSAVRLRPRAHTPHSNTQHEHKYNQEPTIDHYPKPFGENSLPLLLPLLSPTSACASTKCSLASCASHRQWAAIAQAGDMHHGWYHTGCSRVAPHELPG